MRFLDRLAAGEFAVALEITPPQRHLPKVLLRRARLLGDAADAVNVIQRPDRQSSLEASLELLAAGIDPVWHLAARGETRASVAAITITCPPAMPAPHTPMRERSTPGSPCR
ncbi:MAG: hypothetical protein WHT63_03510 [Tepidiforma sp.]